MSAQTHPHLPLQHPLGTPSPGSRGPRWHSSRGEHATLLIVSAVLVLALTILLLALVRTLADRESVRAGGASATSLTLPVETPAFQERGVIYAPSGYAPPGIWTPKSGPGPVR
jgi:hypothetical protein